MAEKLEKSGPKASAAVAVRSLTRQALKGALATLLPSTGAPYASLVTLATTVEGAPLLLLSRLAVHTQNLAADSRVSVMIDGTSPAGDPLAGGRVSLMGRIAITADAAHRRRFLNRHPEAEMYAGFSDFAFYQLHVETAHFVGGFGRIVDLDASDVLIDVSGAAALAAAEDDILEHMNADHADAVALYAASSGSADSMSGTWRMCGIDPEGLDVRGPSGAARLNFSSPIATPGDARRALAALASQARSAMAEG